MASSAASCEHSSPSRDKSFAVLLSSGLVALLVALICLSTGPASGHKHKLLASTWWPNQAPSEGLIKPSGLFDGQMMPPSGGLIRPDEATRPGSRRQLSEGNTTRTPGKGEWPANQSQKLPFREMSGSSSTRRPEESPANQSRLLFKATRFYSFDADHSPVLPTQDEERWKKYVAICMVSRDDHEDDLQEWIEYHLRIGVDVIYMVEHRSAVPMFSSLLKYIRTSQLVYHFLETPRNEQVYVYEFCVRTYGRRHRWMGFIDTDEFVVIPSGKPIKDILKDYEAYPGLSINWRYIGSSGHVTRPTKGVLASYSNCGLKGSRHVKTFADPSQIRQIDNAHFQHYAHNARAVNVRKWKVNGPFSVPPMMETMFLNHYLLKSVEDWNEKQRRWKGWTGKKWWNRTEMDARLSDYCTPLQIPGPPWQPEKLTQKCEEEAERRKSEKVPSVWEKKMHKKK